MTVRKFLLLALCPAPASAAHIYCCAGPGANAPVVINFIGQGFQRESQQVRMTTPSTWRPSSPASAQVRF